MPRKGENIYKRKDGRWEGRYIRSRTPTGKVVYGYVYGKSYREAKNKLNSHQNTQENGTEQPSTSKSVALFQNLSTEWLSSKNGQIKESTFVKYSNILKNYLLPEYKSVPVSDISSTVVEQFVGKLITTGGKRKKGLSKKTVSDIMSVLFSVLKYAQKHGHTISDCLRYEIATRKDVKPINLSGCFL